MATVWRGCVRGAAGFARTVAIKRMLPSLSESEDFAAMFVEEARVVADLSHPNIVQVQDFGLDERGGYFIVMEWVEGLDLGRWLFSHRRDRVPTAWQSVVTVGAAIARALYCAHERVDGEGRPAPVFHRDVTPSNILIDVYGVPKLSDFGLARAMDRITLTTPGVVKGKLAYVAPELVGGHKASSASDVYSLGVVLWEALAGRRLFEAGNALARDGPRGHPAQAWRRRQGPAGAQRERGPDPEAGLSRQARSAPTSASTLALASPKSMRVFGSKKSGFCTPA